MTHLNEFLDQARAQAEGFKKAREKATPGPWSWEPWETKGGTPYQSVLAVGMDNPRRGDAIFETYHHDAIGPVPFQGEMQTLPPRQGRRQDADFAVHAANNGPPLAETLLKLVECVRVMDERLAIAANQLEGVSLAIQKHGQNIDTEFFISNYAEFANNAREARAEVLKLLGGTK
jgi:hypothetical protein